LYDAGNPNLVLNDNLKGMGWSRSWERGSGEEVQEDFRE